MSKIAAVLVLAGFWVAAASAADLMLEDFEAGASAIAVSATTDGSVGWEIREEAGRHYLHVRFTRPPGETHRTLRIEPVGNAYVRLPFTKELMADGPRFDGLRLRLRGDGSSTYGTMEIRCDENRNRFQAVFSVSSTEWSDVAVRWDDFLKTNDGTPVEHLKWDDITSVAFGSLEQWGAAAFDVESIAFADLSPREPLTAGPGMDRLARTHAKLAAGETVTIVGYGDSVTLGTKVAPELRPGALYYGVAAGRLAEKFGGAVTPVNAGIGGETGARALVRLGHDVAPKNPDLVFVLFGANDAYYEHSVPRVRHALSVLVDHLLRDTDADILVLSPSRAISMIETLRQYRDAYADVAREKGVAYFDLLAVFESLPPDEQDKGLADDVHMNEHGHMVAGEAIAHYIIGLSPESSIGP